MSDSKKYIIKKRHETHWDKLAGGSGVKWIQFGQPQETLEEAIMYAVNAYFLFDREQFIVGRLT